VPIDVTAGWAVSLVNTKSQLGRLEHLALGNNKVAWLEIKPGIFCFTRPILGYAAPLSYTHMHTHTPMIQICMYRLLHDTHIPAITDLDYGDSFHYVSPSLMAVS